MSNWLLKAAEDWLQPVYDVLHQRLCQEKVLHGDETTLQVLHEKGKSATSKSYMWLYRTSGNAETPIVLYDYQPNRKAENAEKFLEGFTGWLHADGYQGYHRLPENIRVVGCWAHARRKFDEALTAVPKEQQSASKPAEALCYFAKLFQMEQDFAVLTVEERFAKRLEQEKPVLEALLAWANRLKPQTAPKSALGLPPGGHVHQQELHIRLLLVGLLEFRHLALAGAAPAGPEIKHQRLAEIVAEPHGVAVGIVGCEIRRAPVLRGFFPGGLPGLRLLRPAGLRGGLGHRGLLHRQLFGGIAAAQTVIQESRAAQQQDQRQHRQPDSLSFHRRSPFSSGNSAGGPSGRWPSARPPRSGTRR